MIIMLHQIVFPDFMQAFLANIPMRAQSFVGEIRSFSIVRMTTGVLAESFGYGWKSGALYFAPEAYVDYANVSNSLVDTVITGSGTVTKVSLDRRVGAGINLIGGVTAFDDQVLVYGLLGGGATNFAGNITVNATTLSADIWYPVFSAGGGIEWAWTDNLALRLEGKHTFYYDVSDRIFPSNTDQAYNFDTTSVSVGITWRPWN
jgi:opacity protein-like surface antigen